MNQIQEQRRRNSESKIRRGRTSRYQFQSRRGGLELLESRLMLAGTWTPLTNLTPTANAPRFALLSDGNILMPVATSNGGSVKLTPGPSGSYINGTWSSAAGMSVVRASAASLTVLQDGRVWLLGGTNGVYINAGETYNLLTNSWSSIANFPESTFGNGPTMLLADGRELAGSINGPRTYIYNPVTNTWSNGPTKLDNDSNNHESWTKLPDGSVLSVNVNNNPGHAQRLDPTTMTWIDSGIVPVALEAGVSAYLNMGPGVVLPDGRVLQLGRSSTTAIYTPSSTPGGTGTWAPGPVIPDGLEAGGSDPAASSAAAMMPNGQVLFSADKPDSGGPTRLYEFNPLAPLATSLTDATPPIAQYQSNSVAYAVRLLTLPGGQVLFGNGNSNGLLTGTNQLYLYNPDGAPQAAWKPTITNVVANGDHYTLTGTQLNGLSVGASEGGSTQFATNYPIIELKDASGFVFFARTFNWSSTGVQTGSLPVTTDFTIPSFLPAGTYSLTAIANGISSDPVPFVVPVAGDFNFDGQLTGADVPAMMAALTDVNTFKKAFGLSDFAFVSIGDLNGDHVVNNADLQALLTKLRSTAPSSPPQMVLDISNGSMDSNPQNLFAIGNTVFFAADDGIHGTELWKSDGTAAGTFLVKDINAGSGRSYPYGLANLNGTLFFSADDGIHGTELWKSDGTPGGTVLVKDINPGSGASFPGGLTVVNGTLFFQAYDPTHGTELWKSDGTAVGTVLVKDIVFGSQESAPGNLTNVNGTLFFEIEVPGYPTHLHTALWKSDGSAAGTVLVKDIYPGSSAEPILRYLTNVNGTLFFEADDGVHGETLWKSDGTAAGTVLIADTNPSGAYSYVRDLTNVNGTLFFRANDGNNGEKLWKSDGTAAGTVLVKDISGNTFSPLYDQTNVNGTLFFQAYDPIFHGSALWKSDGTATGTVLVKDITPSTARYYLRFLTNVNGTLFFRADDGKSGRELWKSDGTAAGTVQVADLNPGAAASAPENLTSAGNTLFFTADDGIHGRELWELDTAGSGTPINNGPQQVLDINGALAVGSSPTDLLTIGNTTYFTADDGIHGRELWKTDGTASGTLMVKDINPDKEGSDPYGLTEFKGVLYFAADDGTSGTELWKSDGTEAGTVMVEDIFPGTYYDQKAQTFRAYSSNPGPFTKFNGELYFPANDGVHGFELWKTDGTKDGTVLVKDIAPGAFDGLPYGGVYSFLTPIGGELYFAADDGDHGEELWKTDGTDAGTVLVKDIVPGSYGSVPYNLINMNGTLFFDAYQDDTGNDELFKCDGTEAGTVLVADINPGSSGSYLYSPTPINGILYFTANDGSHGKELWRSDGTTTGTQLVADLNAGPTGAQLGYLTKFNGTLFFVGNDGTHGSELWKSDGTAGGTTLVKDINLGSAGSNIKGIVNVNGTLYFSANDGTHGNELWKSDGTAAGTVMAQDLNLRSVDSNPSNFTVLGKSLLFTADDGFHGTELWKLPLASGGGSAISNSQLRSDANTTAGVSPTTNVEDSAASSEQIKAPVHHFWNRQFIQGLRTQLHRAIQTSPSAESKLTAIAIETGAAVAMQTSVAKPFAAKSSALTRLVPPQVFDVLPATTNPQNCGDVAKNHQVVAGPSASAKLFAAAVDQMLSTPYKRVYRKLSIAGKTEEFHALDELLAVGDTS